MANIKLKIKANDKIKIYEDITVLNHQKSKEDDFINKARVGNYKNGDYYINNNKKTNIVIWIEKNKKNYLCIFLRYKCTKIQHSNLYYFENLLIG